MVSRHSQLRYTVFSIQHWLQVTSNYLETLQNYERPTCPCIVNVRERGDVRAPGAWAEFKQALNLLWLLFILILYLINFPLPYFDTFETQ